MNMSIAEAKSQFSQVVDRAEAGEEITITRHGKPVARVVPIVTEHDRDRAKKAFERMRRLREETGATLGDLNWKDLRDEGRR
jgi:prevent-host-death family protein